MTLPILTYFDVKSQTHLTFTRTHSRYDNAQFLTYIMRARGGLADTMSNKFMDVHFHVDRSSKL